MHVFLAIPATFARPPPYHSACADPGAGGPGAPSPPLSWDLAATLAKMSDLKNVGPYTELEATSDKQLKQHRTAFWGLFYQIFIFLGGEGSFTPNP